MAKVTMNRKPVTASHMSRFSRCRCSCSVIIPILFISAIFNQLFRMPTPSP